MTIWQQTLKKVSLSLLIIIAIFAVIVYFYLSKQNPSAKLSKLPDRSLQSIKIGNCQLNVEIVHSPNSITQGLSGRTSIGSDGMLFVLPNKDRHTFWMPDMNFSLDIIWLDENLVTDISHNVPYPDKSTPHSQLPLYKPQKPVNLVLELAANRANECQISQDSKLLLQ